MTVAPWITVDELNDPEHVDAALIVEAVSGVLWELSGRRYNGVRTIVETYCQLSSHEIPGLSTPYSVDGKIYNGTPGECTRCSCFHAIKLRGVPIIEIEAVSIGGAYLSPSEYSIYDYSYLSLNRTTLSCWGSCEEVTITYAYGAPPPALGKLAARELADQLIWSLTDDERCVLPQRITSVNRQGLSWTLLDPQDFLDEGRTGLYLVDLFLKAVNPDKARRRARVFSVDRPHGRSRR